LGKISLGIFHCKALSIKKMLEQGLQIRMVLNLAEQICNDKRYSLFCQKVNDNEKSFIKLVTGATTSTTTSLMRKELPKTSLKRT